MTFAQAVEVARRDAVVSGKAQRVFRPKYGASQQAYRVQPSDADFDERTLYTVVTVNAPERR